MSTLMYSRYKRADVVSLVVLPWSTSVLYGLGFSGLVLKSYFKVRAEDPVDKVVSSAQTY